MGDSTVHIISRVHNELKTKERGVRFWEMIEVTGDRWFQIEVHEHQSSTQSRAHSYILSDINRVLNILKTLRSSYRAELRLYTRLPMVAPTGFILEKVRQVFTAENGGHMFVLQSGLILYDTSHDSSGRLSLADAKEVYRYG